MSTLIHIYTHKPLRKIKVTLCNHQADISLYVWPNVWFGELQVQKKYGHTWRWMSLLRPSVIRQHKPIRNMCQAMGLNLCFRFLTLTTDWIFYLFIYLFIYFYFFHFFFRRQQLIYVPKHMGDFWLMWMMTMNWGLSGKKHQISFSILKCQDHKGQVANLIRTAFSSKRGWTDHNAHIQ